MAVRDAIARGALGGIGRAAAPGGFAPGPWQIGAMDRFAFVLTPARRVALRLRLNEAAPLLSLCALSLFAWAFVKVAGEVFEGDTESLDRRILLGLRNSSDLSDPIGPQWFEEAAPPHQPASTSDGQCTPR